MYLLYMISVYVSVICNVHNYSYSIKNLSVNLPLKSHIHTLTKEGEETPPHMTQSMTSTAPSITIYIYKGTLCFTWMSVTEAQRCGHRTTLSNGVKWRKSAKIARTERRDMTGSL